MLFLVTMTLVCLKYVCAGVCNTGYTRVYNMCVQVCVIPVIYKSVTICVCRCVLHGVVVVVVVLGFYVPPTAKVIRRRDLGLKSHPKDWRSPGSISRHLVYKASSLTTTTRRLLLRRVLQRLYKVVTTCSCKCVLNQLYKTVCICVCRCYTIGHFIEIYQTSLRR